MPRALRELGVRTEMLATKAANLVWPLVREWGERFPGATDAPLPLFAFLLLRERNGEAEETFLAPNEKLSNNSSAAITLDGTMTCREASESLGRAFGVVVEFSVESGRSVMNVALDRAR